MIHDDFNFIDAFIELNSLTDDDVAGMLKPEKQKANNIKVMTEGKEFAVGNNKGIEKAAEFREETKASSKDDVKLEVIDPDATAVNQIKNNSAYVGNAILTCNKCQAPIFLAMDKLQPDESNSDLYNKDLECPNCHASNVGFTLVAQAAKVEEPESDTDVTFDNSENNNDDPFTFSNDASTEETPANNPETATDANNGESEEPSTDISSVDNIDISGFEDTDGSDDLETSATEDDGFDVLADESTPKAKKKLKLKLGDETDIDDDLEIDDEDVQESLHEDFMVNSEENAKEAWLMGQVIQAMNNEEAYYDSGWLYYWPDECDYDECVDTFSS